MSRFSGQGVKAEPNSSGLTVKTVLYDFSRIRGSTGTKIILTVSLNTVRRKIHTNEVLSYDISLAQFYRTAIRASY